MADAVSPPLLRQQPGMIPYVEVQVALHGCVQDPVLLVERLESWLREAYACDFDSDIDVQLTTTAGWHPTPPAQKGPSHG